MFTFLDSTTSTNDEAKLDCYHHGDIVSAEYQTAGRGQKGNRWSSAAGKNLMFSLVIEPHNLDGHEQFSLLETVALSLVDTFAHHGIDTSIKWTNDIYAGNHKLTGVLMEQTLCNGKIGKCIAGIGINVNQTEFDPSLPNPTSMKLLTGCEFDRRAVLDTFYECFNTRYEVLDSGETESIHNHYIGRMFRLGCEAEFATPSGERFRGTIRDVEPTGALIIETLTGIRKFLFKEISFII